MIHADDAVKAHKARLVDLVQQWWDSDLTLGCVQGSWRLAGPLAPWVARGVMSEFSDEEVRVAVAPLLNSRGWRIANMGGGYLWLTPSNTGAAA